MEYAANGNLASLISRKFETLSINIKYDIAFQLVKGIEFLHNHKIVHRDIKPANILLDKKNKVYLCDFGLASIVGGNEKAKGCNGTISFVSPELFQKNCSSNKSDIWSLGVVLYNLYYGELPFGENKISIEEIVNEILNKKIRLHQAELKDNNEKELNDKLISIIQMCLNKDEKQRPSAKEIVQLF